MQKQTTSPKNEKFRQFYQQVYPKIKNRHTPYAIAQKILHPRMFYAARLLDEAIMDEKRKAFEGLFSDNSPVAAAILDKEGRITKANKKLHEIMESQEGGLLGTQMFLADGLGKILPSKIQEGSGAASFEYTLDFGKLSSAGAKTQKEGACELNLAAFEVKSGLNDKEYLILFGKKEHRQMEEIQRMKAALKSKDEFIRLLAHDIRNPLATLIEILEVLKDEPDVEPGIKSRLIEGSFKRAKLVLDLVVNLLEWYQLSGGRRKAEPVFVNLFESVEVAAALNDMQKKRLEFENRVGRQQVVYADPDMLDAILRNLISNAVKYSKQGGKIVVGANELADGKVEIKVEDNGIGMSKERAAEIFRPDRKRLSDAGTAGEEGTGFGLVLTKKMVEENGGEISVQSELGKGTVFTILLPSGPASQAK